jgi:hypothetical protein
MDILTKIFKNVNSSNKSTVLRKQWAVRLAGTSWLRQALTWWPRLHGYQDSKQIWATKYIIMVGFMILLVCLQDMFHRCVENGNKAMSNVATLIYPKIITIKWHFPHQAMTLLAFVVINLWLLLMLGCNPSLALTVNLSTIWKNSKNRLLFTDKLLVMISNNHLVTNFKLFRGCKRTKCRRPLRNVPAVECDQEVGYFLSGRK